MTCSNPRYSIAGTTSTNMTRGSKRKLDYDAPTKPLREKKLRRGEGRPPDTDSDGDGISAERRRPAATATTGLRNYAPRKTLPSQKPPSTVLKPARISLPIQIPKRDYRDYSNSPPQATCFKKNGEFRLNSSQCEYFSSDEAKERRRCARIDFAARNSDYIIKMCEKLRGNLWTCKIDEEAGIIVGCRNYIVTLVFDDGSKWLLKTGQESLKWSKYKPQPGMLDGEIATILWLYWETNIPVPRVRLWDVRTTTRRNRFGKPWYVMEMSKGTTVYTQIEEELEKSEEFDWDAIQPQRYEHMARIDLEFLRHQSPVKGEYQLRRGVLFFHGDRELPRELVKLYRNEGKERVGLKEKMLSNIDTCRDKLQHKIKRFGIEYKEGPIHLLTLDALETLIPKLIDPRFNNTYVMTHGDTTDSNVMCDREFYTTAIIDWELGKFRWLQQAVCLPTEESNTLLDYIPTLVNESIMQIDSGSVAAAKWAKLANCEQQLRDKLIDCIAKIDNGVPGDAATPWTAGHGYVTGLYKISYAVHMVWRFLEDYTYLLMQNKHVRIFIANEIVKIAEGAVEVIERDGLFSQKVTEDDNDIDSSPANDS
ncbi:hypothetical protein H072_2764 [Dactylellina haptotyla CBS 200.50]|uniref:Uncharacterized protein n=1 Tax=Dactylellina haptotyla (strain CBS 200.50) TaxID=1284197 RepID=S8AQC1_DACHA|nr:hypothetical protein H072_2764 [Dactylellina haptotyla CBS 200.50]